ncbi:Hypothetical protein SMAX5B_008121 [Scophthalmus maximus]|uniref:Uncharacterized protein n=1 Tax=Scophthalmus maximus TaxID=52904 RepID=A0A2U9CTD8_SCOMX|nr:Hypothetical protein SMAX5B_008121 [Scophthalmus maximus]
MEVRIELKDIQEDTGGTTTDVMLNSRVVVRSSHSNNKLGLNGAGMERGGRERTRLQQRERGDGEKVMGM